MSVKTSFVLPKDIYDQLKRRALEERRPVRDLLIDAILLYLSSARKKRKELIEVLLRPVDGAGPEDFKEYDYSDVGD